MSGSFVETMKMIKIEHSIFALPFALASAVLAADGLPSGRILILILVAMVAARSAAMAFNRFIDADIDKENPRTAIRSIPAGRLTKRYALVFTLTCCVIFVGTAWLLNPLAFKLAVPMLMVLLGYSLTKRFTALCHVVLGISLGLAPLGAWIAVTGEFSWIPVYLGLAVTGWTAGFDIIYACQDFEFDRDNKLHSIPTALGISKSLWLSRILHISMFSLLIWFGFHVELGLAYWIGIGLVAICLVYEHVLVWGGDLSKVDQAFFMMNGIISLVFGATTITAIML